IVLSLSFVGIYIVLFTVWCFFFSSRRRHTRSKRDWSSECALPILAIPKRRGCARPKPSHTITSGVTVNSVSAFRIEGISRKANRSEERRVGKEWRDRRGARQGREKRWKEEAAKESEQTVEYKGRSG